jgi:hypothetical protein
VRREGAGSKPRTRKAGAAVGDEQTPAATEHVSYAQSSLHELFDRQVREMLDRTDLGEEQKQAILIGMSCPCCGGAAMSYTAKLKR